MALVHVVRVTDGWPQGDPEEGDPNLTTIDCEIDGVKYVRMGYVQGVVTSASEVEAALTSNASILLNVNKQYDNPFPVPPGGVDKPDWVPSDFNI